MKRFILKTPPNGQSVIRLYGDDYHYLVRVRRLKSGDCFNAVLPGGEETIVRILSTVDRILLGECLPGNSPSTLTYAETAFAEAAFAQAASAAPLPPIVLFQGLPKGAKMDLIIRQAAENCLSAVAPFNTEYSTAKLERSGKLQRWERIVKETRQQSGSAAETLIHPAFSFESLIAYWEEIKKERSRPLGILLHQEPLAKGTFHGYLDKKPDLVVLAVGPEGGFSPREVKLFTEAGFKPLLMGDTILRTETAALFCVAAVRIILLESNAWSSAQTE